jgi:SAM-dependent methyltransferase
MPGYVFDNKEAETAQRFGALEELFDPISKRHLETHVVPGAHCLEVGGGAGSIALWMSERVGASGRVVVTDLNTRFLDAIGRPNIEVRKHDIVTDALEDAAFDVAHTRCVLLHIPERVQALERILAAIKPGGMVVLQEFDSESMLPDPAVVSSEHLLKSATAMWESMAAHGVNRRFGRELYPLLQSMGLRDVEAEGHLSVWRGGSAGARVWRANFEQIRDDIMASGRLTEREFAEDIARLDDPSVMWPSPVLWTARGRKP